MRIISISLVCFLLFSCNSANNTAPNAPVEGNPVSETMADENTDTIKILAWETTFDAASNDSVYDLYINTDYIKAAPEPVKAILAFYSTKAGTDCTYNGEPNEDYSNIECIFTTELGLGQQCGSAHIDLIKKWFRSEPAILEDANSCYSSPNTATSQSSLHKILLKQDKDRITVWYEINGTHLREQESWEYSGTDKYQLSPSSMEVKVISRTESAVKREHWEYED